MNRPFPIALSGLAIFALAGCESVGPDFDGAPQIDHDARFAGANPYGTASPAEVDRWWSKLGDRQLDRLVETALKQNFDLGIATERLRQSRNARRGVASQFLPQVTASAGYTNVGLSENTDDFSAQAARGGAISSEFDQWDIGGDFSWEIDVFGGGRRQVEAAGAQADAAREAVHAARLATVSEVADAYYTIAGFRAQIATVEENIQLQSKTHELVKKLGAEGMSSKLDVQRTAAQLESTRAAKPTLEAGLTTQLRRLALLIGEPPGSLDRQVDRWGRFPDRLPMVRTGVPAELITRRPDLRQAERELAAATAEIGVATAEFYPRFYLLGKGQGVSASTANLFDAASFAWQFAPRVEWSVFSSGRNRALLDSANSRQREAMLSYEKAVLGAIGEVESQLAALQAEQRRHAYIGKAVTASRTAVELATELERAGRTSLLDLLVEQQRLNVLSLDQTRSRTALVLNWIRLHRALGGGWERD